MRSAATLIVLAASPPGAFVPFGWLHAATVVTFALMVAAAVVAGRALSTRGQRERLDLALALAVIAAYGSLVGWWLAPAQRSITISLPLHLCDVANLTAALALVFPWRGFRVLLHFWAFGLTTQAFITPTLASGPSSPYFWIFWGYHFAIVGTAVYDIACRGFRPGWRDCGFAIAATTLYVAVVFPVNLLTGGNYGYVGASTPGTTTVLDALGPYPARVGTIALLGISAFVTIQLVWTGLGWWSMRRSRRTLSAAGPTETRG